MICANTAELLQAAEQLDAQADAIELAGALLEQALRDTRAQKRILFVFRRCARDMNKLARQRAGVVERLRNHSLYLQECAKRYKGAQSWVLTKADKLR